MPYGGDITDKDIKISSEKLDAILSVGKNFDVVRRTVTVCGRKCAVYFIDGMTKDDTVQHVLDTLIQLPEKTFDGINGLTELCRTCISYIEVSAADDYGEAAAQVLSGVTALICDGVSGAVCMDCRKFPCRNTQEPENDKVLRGSRVGFVETLTVNTAMIRRYIRDASLVMSAHKVGSVSRTDVIVCYIRGKADPEYAGKLERMIDGIKTDALTLGAQSLAECLVKRKWYNPFPKIRYTERPDCAAAHLIEGRVLIITDNSPAVMILPAAIFDFMQETDDYYLPPLVGTYFRAIRCTVFFLTLFLSPLWYLLISYPQWIPPWLSFIKTSETAVMPVIAQLFVLEFAVDGLKLAALNTPSMLSGSFSIIGGLILGDLAVKVGWFIPDTIFYMAFVAVANFSQPSYELGYTFKFLRLALLLLTALFGVYGFIGGFALFIVLLCTNKTVGGKSYLYPLIPFNAKALFAVTVRTRKK